METATFAQLLSPAGQELLAEVEASSESDLALGTRLRRDHAADLVAAAVSQTRLRARAVPKLGDDARRMYFTADALEQATRASVAGLRAERLAGSDVRAVLDLGCGIGGDLVAFARAGLRVRGVERDAVRAAMARANLAALGLTVRWSRPTPPRSSPSRVRCRSSTRPGGTRAAECSTRRR